MLNLLDPPGVVQCEPIDWPQYDSEPPPRAACSMLEWVQAQRSYHALLSDCGDEEHALVVRALVVVWCAVEMHRPATVAALLVNRYAVCYRLDLSTVRPRGERRSPLAAHLDYEAGRFLAMDSDLGTLCAWAIFRQADDCERFNSATVEDYLADEAAHRAAWEDAAAEGY
jgi:hypothetical protein